MDKNKSIIIVVLSLILFGLIVYGGFKMIKGDDVILNQDIVATVNGVEILKTTYDTQLAATIATLTTQGVDVNNAETKAQIETNVLNDLINNEVVNQAVVASKLTVTAEEVEAQFQVLLTQAGSPEAFATQLTTANLTEEQLRINIGKQLTVQKFLQQNIDVTGITATDKEIEDLYNQTVAASPEQTFPPLEEVKDQVSTQVVLNKQQALINDFVKTLRDKATVELAK